MLHSRPKSAVGTPAYIAPEVLSRREYDGKVSLSPLNSFINYMFIVSITPSQDILLGHSQSLSMFMTLCKYPFALLSFSYVEDLQCFSITIFYPHKLNDGN